MLNPYCYLRLNASLLKDFFKKYRILVNNNTDFFIRSANGGILIIDLVFTSPDFRCPHYEKSLKNTYLF